MRSAPRFLARVLVSVCLPLITRGLALVAPPLQADPVIFGTSDYSNILFGKAQRASSVYGTNLGHPLTVLSPSCDDSEGKLERCLWTKFGMSTSGPDGTLDEADVTRGLTEWIPQADLGGALVFIDATSASSRQQSSDNDGIGSSIFGALPFFGKKEKQVTPEAEAEAGDAAAAAEVSSINLDLLRCAVERHCAHIYVLSDDRSLPSCVSTLEEHASSIPSTVLALERGAVLTTTGGWASTRPQDMKGELTGPVALSAIDAKGEISGGPATVRARSFPAEDAAEVMLQVALRADRAPELDAVPRVVRLQRADANARLEERPNEDYFTRTGGKKARAAAGTVQSAVWGSVLAPFGQVITNLSDRPDV